MKYLGPRRKEDQRRRFHGSTRDLRKVAIGLARELVDEIGDGALLELENAPRQGRGRPKYHQQQQG